MDGRYQSIPIERAETAAGDIYQGYSPALNLILRWQGGTLLWLNPQTGRHIATYDDMREELERERDALSRAREAWIQEREARVQAEARVRELENEIERLKGD